jgi:hypothetical protein
VLARACAGVAGGRAQAERADQVVARVRHGKTRGGVRRRAGARRPRRRAAATRCCKRGAGGACNIVGGGQHTGAKAHGCHRCRDGAAQESVCRARARAARGAAPAADADHDDWLVSADRVDPRDARRLPSWRIACARLSRAYARGNGAFGAQAGSAGARRARAWRSRTQRHGRIFRRAVVGLRGHGKRLGAELWLALREAAAHLRRRVSSRADHRRSDPLRAVAHDAPAQGHADRAGNAAAMVVRARRPAARDHGAATRPCDPRRSA